MISFPGYTPADAPASAIFFFSRGEKKLKKHRARICPHMHCNCPGKSFIFIAFCKTEAHQESVDTLGDIPVRRPEIQGAERLYEKALRPDGGNPVRADR